MADFENRVVGLRSLATRRLGGETWNLDGTEVTAVFTARYNKVAFGDERFKNVDMTGVGVNAIGPVLRLPTVNVPDELGRGDAVYLVGGDSDYSVVSIEHNNGMTTIRIKNEA